MELHAPSVLAQLPLPLETSAGKCQLGEVYGVDGSKKRKRHEVTAAIDGESVIIYNVQFPKLVTSYAIPPQSSFSCPPLSVRQKSTQKYAAARRRTYCAIEQPENQIQCFLDESTTGTHNTLNISSSSFKLKESRSPVVFLNIIPAVSEAGKQQDPFDILLVHRDGRVRRLSPDLQTQKWNVLPDLAIEQPAMYEIQTGFLVSFEDVRKSLFKERQDIVATVLGDEIGTESAASSVLVLVSRPSGQEKLLPSDIKVVVFCIPTRAAENDFSINQSKRLRHLMTISLPDLEDHKLSFGTQSHQWNFYPASSSLSLTFANGFINYDISQYSPDISSHMILPEEHFSSIMRISPQSVIGARKSSVAIYNPRYQSIQGDLSLDDISPVGTTKPDADKGDPIVFISYFAKLGIAVATRGETLLGFDLASSHDVSLNQASDGLLINAIGKGIQSPEYTARIAMDKPVDNMQQVGLSEPHEVAQWAALNEKLDTLVKDKDPGKFDRTIQEALSKMSTAGGDGKSRHLRGSTVLVEPEKIYFLLGKIFSLRTTTTEPKASKLVVSFLPPKTFKWLISSHHLSLSNIQAALRHSMHPKIPPPIPSGSLVRALSEHSLQLLLQVLRGPINLEAVELTHALKILLDVARSRQQRPEEELPKTITESPHPTKESIAQEITQGHHNTSSNTSNGPDTITDAITGLNLTLTKLHFHPLDKVTQSIRSVLSNSDTLSIIHHLRHSLATGGYTSPFVEQSTTPLPADPKTPTLDLSTMVDLLTSCIDAIGPSGWISAAAFAGGEDSEACLIADMKSEISAALVGVEEATYLKGILREFVRYAETAIATNANNSNAYHRSRNSKHSPVQGATLGGPPGSRLKRKERHNGADILIYDTENINGINGALNSDKQMLPLSLKRVAIGGEMNQDVGGAAANGVKVGEEVSRSKIRRTTGEVVQRSERELGYLRRKAVGKYSFEKIVI
ncbi:hypothetical protein GX48_00738 [Paracoccidioides brasiliensis]|nr:hypothetical protein GX48_00738 [Paracoccidioides brasiliensis]